MPDPKTESDLDEHISCTLCKGLLIDAVTLTECAHSCKCMDDGDDWTQAFKKKLSKQAASAYSF